MTVFQFPEKKMQVTRAVRIDMPYLLLAYEDQSPDNLYYLDTKSGLIKLVHKHLFDLRDLTDEIERDRERYLYVPKTDKSVLLNDLREFQKQVADPALQSVLSMAFESPHQLSSFRKILEGKGDYLERFEAYRTERITGRINEWLHANAFKHDPDAKNELDENSADFFEDFYDDEEED
jgi:hypothetical protein